MRSHAGKNLPMQNASLVMDKARSAVSVLVEREQRKTGSRMVAYEVIAGSIGASASWVRKFVARNPDVKPDFIVGLNIIDMYNRLCTRVEQEAEIERVKIMALKDELDAATPGAAELVARTMRAPPAGTED